MIAASMAASLVLRAMQRSEGCSCNYLGTRQILAAAETEAPNGPPFNDLYPLMPTMQDALSRPVAEPSPLLQVTLPTAGDPPQRPPSRCASTLQYYFSLVPATKAPQAAPR